MQTQEQARKAYLLLADGSLFEGLSIGTEGTVIGEVVFTTGMTGYQQTLTDPNYDGQLITQTFPLIGNYGVNRQDGESAKVAAKGYIVRELCETPSNFRSEGTLGAFLQAQQVVGICGIDTRALTRHLREHGVMNGMITTAHPRDTLDAKCAEIRAHRSTASARTVTSAAPAGYEAENATCRVAVLDCGIKQSLLDAMTARGCSLQVYPCTTPAAELLAGGIDGVLLSNGPGDPAQDRALIETVRTLCESGLPVFGVGLGHQLVALAMGASTEKLGHGHRGANQPVICLSSGRTFVSGQNHGYVVSADSIPAALGEVTHVSANDRSCEGACYHGGRIRTVQFDPQSCDDADAIFAQFLKLMQKGGN